MYSDSTVFALSTPVGGAIAVMRISGPNAEAVLSRIFTGGREHRRAFFGRIIDEESETVDTAVAVLFRAPSSYTGEDVAELSFHGSYAVAARLAELIEGTGLAVPAEPGEFTRRAYLNGKLDLAQAEAVMDLISSSAERSRRAAVLQLSGRTSAVISLLYERVRLETARLANYMEDDTGEAELETADFSRNIKEIQNDIDALASSGMRSRILREGARAVLTGSPNVGKSSLLNALLMRERAIVTPIPGTTRDTVEESVSVCGIPVVLVDTAGIREPSDEIERLGVERAFVETENADLVLLLIDSSRGLNDDDRDSLRSARGRNTLVVLAKKDLPSVLNPDEDGIFCSFPCVRVSAMTGEGLNELRARMAEMLLPTGAEEPVITNSRHIAALEAASAHISSASEEVLADMPDAALFELREAMEALASILGKNDVGEELVDSIFSNFCIGK